MGGGGGGGGGGGEGKKERVWKDERDTLFDLSLSLSALPVQPVHRG